ncbi:MAGUK p55 subfamily member 5 [Plakobranchus ocellatus]|uniref:MAGUK p55 subfamily member 5 n=1 Tax=Plakobranchus ocellatus TaxID=259542 RepID=A0AAV4AI48_9GAST|nr:MAGUK p55 subfamily member 5 [Plakobranchus ocellatus]
MSKSDEIIEVNGRVIKNVPREFLTRYIYQPFCIADITDLSFVVPDLRVTCIKSRTVSLRVKRRKQRRKKALNITKVHDAYVIALEDEARQRLEDFTTGQQVQAVDMTQVCSTSPGVLTTRTTFNSLPSSAGSATRAGWAPKTSTVGSSPTSPFGSATLNSLTPSNSSINSSQVKSAVDSGNSSSSSSKKDRKGTAISSAKSKNSNSRKKKKGRQEKYLPEEIEEEYTVIDNPVYGSLIQIQQALATDRSLPMPGEKKKKTTNQGPNSGESSHTNGGGGGGGVDEEWLEMNGIREKEPAKKNKGKRRSKAGSSSPDTEPSNTIINSNYLNAMGNGRGNGSSEVLDGRLEGYVNGLSNHNHYHGGNRDSTAFEVDDPGFHREMAIDVPENFVASIKSPPRYPPPHSSTASSPTSHSKGGGKGGSAMHSQQNSLSPMGSANSKNMQHIQPTPEELERLHRHQEDLKKRREEESRYQAEQEFLRASLRGSKKLQALEENRREVAALSTGFVNTAYDDEEGVDDIDDGMEFSPGRLELRRPSDEMIEEPYLKKNIGVEDLFSNLHYLRNHLTSSEDQKHISYLRSLFQSEQFQQAVNLHSQLVEITGRSPPPKPLTDEATELHAEVHHYTSHSPHNRPAQELLALLNKPHMRSLIEAHDATAQRALQAADEAHLQGEPIDYPLVQYGEDSVKIIHLEKTNEHLGATVKNEGESVVIGRIVKGGAAEKSGLLHEGDEILEVNGIDMRGRDINDVSEMLANMSGTITFMIIPGHSPAMNNTPRSSKVMHLRALFAYDPEDDMYIPCRELGISFRGGDILHATALDDPNWWQAFREGEEEDQSLAGLIPSKSFTEQREAIRRAMENKENKRKTRVCACGRKERKKKKRKSLYNEETDEILTYEEIAKYYPQPNRKRPIVLIGPSNVGRNELQQRLLETDPDRFGTPIPHTTRQPRAGEIEGSAYHYISREVFNNMIQQNQFVEYGDHQKNLYGTSFNSIRDVISQGKVCLLKLQPETLRIIRASDLKPYIIFVCPPNLEKLRQLQEQLDKASPLVEGEIRGRVFTDDELKEIIDRGREIDEIYGHYFDFVLFNNDLERAYQELLDEINKIEMEPQWVPAAWLESL